MELPVTFATFKRDLFSHFEYVKFELLEITTTTITTNLAGWDLLRPPLAKSLYLLLSTWVSSTVGVLLAVEQFYLSLFVLFCFKDMVSLCSPGWH